MDPKLLNTLCFELITKNEFMQAADLVEDHAIINDPVIFDIAANVYCSISQMTEDINYINRGIYWAEKSKKIFENTVIDRLNNTNYLKFVLPIIQPKSGGTYIMDFLYSIGYVDNLYYRFGSASYSFLSEARLGVIYKYGGCILHDHTQPTSHNFNIIKILNQPIWLHLRDPRDAFYSFINMYFNEDNKFRSIFNSISLHYPDHIDKEANNDFMYNDTSFLMKNDMVSGFIWMLDKYCIWIKKWIEFEYDKKFITRYDDLQQDTLEFIKNITYNILENDTIKKINLPDKSFKRNRFFVGKQKQWTKLNSKSIDTINSIFFAYGLDKYFL